MGVCERRALHAQRAHAPTGDPHLRAVRQRPRLAQLARDDRPELRALLARRAHQRHAWVVRVQHAARAHPPLRHARARPEVDHVERAERHDLREARARGGLEARGARAEDPADELVRELGGREVEHAVEEAGGGEPLERTPAGAGRVEDVGRARVAGEQRARVRHRGGGDAEHRDRNALGARSRWDWEDGLGPSESRLVCTCHARDRAGGVFEDGAQDVVEPRDVDDGIHDRDVRVAHEGPDVACGHRAHEEFGETEGEDAEDPGCECGPA